MEILRTTSLRSNFTGSYKKRVYNKTFIYIFRILCIPTCLWNNEWWSVLAPDCHLRFLRVLILTTQSHHRSISFWHLRKLSRLFFMKLRSAICSIWRFLSDDSCWRWFWVAVPPSLPVTVVRLFCWQLVNSIIK